MTGSLRAREISSAPSLQGTTDETVKLIRKLRWIGKDDEASRMQAQLSRFPSEQRGVVATEPADTD
jgi:hypothetical protein